MICNPGCHCRCHAKRLVRATVFSPLDARAANLTERGSGQTAIALVIGVNIDGPKIDRPL